VIEDTGTENATKTNTKRIATSIIQRALRGVWAWVEAGLINPGAVKNQEPRMEKAQRQAREARVGAIGSETGTEIETGNGTEVAGLKRIQNGWTRPRRQKRSKLILRKTSSDGKSA